MRLSSLVYFYRLRLRTRWVQELLALIGIAVGVALLFAAQVASTSLTGSVKQLVNGTVGQADLQLSARDPSGFDATALKRVQHIPGVLVAAPLLEIRANAVGPTGRRTLTLMGADERLAHLDGPLLRQFRTARLPASHVIGLPTPVARDLGVSIGDRVPLEIGATTVRARMGAELSAHELSSLVQSPIAIAPLAYAQQLGGMRGRITRVLVRSAPGESIHVRQALKRLAADRIDVQPADFDLRLFQQAAAPANQSTTLFAAISALVGFLFAFNAMLLTLADRRQLITGLRIDGYSPLAVAQVVVFDALVLGAVASLLGLALGDQLSRQLFDDAPGYLSFAFAVGDQRIVHWQSVAIAVTGGVLATVLAALLPLADSTAPKPGSSGEPADRLWHRYRGMLFSGLAFLIASVGVLVFAPEAAIVGTVMLITALMLMLPGILFAWVGAAEVAVRNVRSAIPLISVGELRSMSARSIALASTGALAVFGSVAIQGAHGDLQRGLDRSTSDISGLADIWVAPGGTPNMLATTPFHDSLGAELRALPSVRAVRLYRAGFLTFGDRRVWTLGLPSQSREPVPASQLLSGDLALATQRLRRHGWAVMSKAIATERHLRVGDRFTLPGPRPQVFRVAALSTNMGWPPGAVILNGDDFSRAWGSTDPTAYQIMLAPGVSPDAGRRAVAGALPPGSALRVQTASRRENSQRAASRQGLSRLSQLGVLVLIAAALAMAAATGGMVWQRRPRLATLKLDGFDDLTVWRALLLESALLLGAGCLTGALFGLCGQRMLDRALSSVTGFPVVDSLGIEVAAASFLLVTIAAVAVAALPGYLAARVPPAAALEG